MKLSWNRWRHPLGFGSTPSLPTSLKSLMKWFIYNLLVYLLTRIYLTSLIDKDSDNKFTISHGASKHRGKGGHLPPPPGFLFVKVAPPLEMPGGGKLNCL